MPLKTNSTMMGIIPTNPLNHRVHQSNTALSDSALVNVAIHRTGTSRLLYPGISRNIKDVPTANTHPTSRRKLDILESYLTTVSRLPRTKLGLLRRQSPTVFVLLNHAFLRLRPLPTPHPTPHSTHPSSPQHIIFDDINIQQHSLRPSPHACTLPL